MAKILIIPDCHGREFWHKAEELINFVDKIVFLGDYLDPYPQEKISFDKALYEFNKILKFKNENSEKVILLLANHDLHYVNLEFMNCSRLNHEKRLDIHKLFQENIDNFQLVYQYDKYLFNHAGIYQEWLDNNNLKLEELFNLKTFLNNKWKTLEDVGWYRGGLDNVGSCIWADIHEANFNTLVPNFIQIVGHTLMYEPVHFNNIHCLDVRKCFILDTETHKIENA